MYHSVSISFAPSCFGARTDACRHRSVQHADAHRRSASTHARLTPQHARSRAFQASARAVPWRGVARVVCANAFHARALLHRCACVTKYARTSRPKCGVPKQRVRTRSLMSAYARALACLVMPLALARSHHSRLPGRATRVRTPASASVRTHSARSTCSSARLGAIPSRTRGCVVSGAGCAPAAVSFSCSSSLSHRVHLTLWCIWECVFVCACKYARTLVRVRMHASACVLSLARGELVLRYDKCASALVVLRAKHMARARPANTQYTSAASQSGARKCE